MFTIELTPDEDRRFRTYAENRHMRPEQLAAQIFEEWLDRADQDAAERRREVDAMTDHVLVKHAELYRRVLHQFAFFLRFGILRLPAFFG